MSAQLTARAHAWVRAALALHSLLAAGCRHEPSFDDTRAFCASVKPGTSLESARQRAVAAGFEITDFAGGKGLLAHTQPDWSGNTKHCQINAVEGRVTKTDFFYD